MNKKAQELLDKAIKLDYGDKLPLFKGVYILQQRKLHDSGYRMMYVIGHTEYDEKLKDYKYYLIGTYSDVVDFQPSFNKYLNRNYDMCDLHLDINRFGMIHIWTNSKRKLECCCPFVSSCSMEVCDE